MATQYYHQCPIILVNWIAKYMSVHKRLSKSTLNLSHLVRIKDCRKRVAVHLKSQEIGFKSSTLRGFFTNSNITEWFYSSPWQWKQGGFVRCPIQCWSNFLKIICWKTELTDQRDSVIIYALKYNLSYIIIWNCHSMHWNISCYFFVLLHVKN